MQWALQGLINGTLIEGSFGLLRVVAHYQSQVTKQQRKLAMYPENSHPQAEQPLLDHAEKLIWSLLDDQIEEEDLQGLEELIKDNEQVRLRYLQCAQIHADLYAHYQTGPVEPAQVQSPVLSSLLSDMSISLGGPTSLVE